MSNPRNPKVSSKWTVLAISFALMTTFAISLQALPPLFNLIMEDIPFSNSQAGMLMGAYAIPGIFLPFLIAYFVQRFDKKSIILISVSLVMLGLIAFFFSQTFMSLLLSRLLAGIGATAILVLAPLLVTIFFDRSNMGIAMGIFNTAMPFGTVLAVNSFAPLGLLLGWRQSILVAAVLAGVVIAINYFVLFLPKSKGEGAAEGSTEPDPQQKPFKMSLSIWLLAAIWVLANAQLLAYITFGPQFFQGVGISVQKAGLLTSFIMLMPIIVGPLVGIVFDKTGRRRGFVRAGTIMMAVSFVFFLKFSGTLPLWAITLGIGFAPIPIYVFAKLPELVEPHQVGMGMGVLTAASNLGITVGPAAFGFILDKTAGSFVTGFTVLAIVSVGVVLSLWGIKKQDRDAT
ncbi:MAG TPA: MFS transporter [Clostridia bacterium]|nr:MFS transporter [Clostridia bacterium]